MEEILLRRPCRDHADVEARIAVLEARLKLIEEAIARQVALPLLSRQREYCIFMDMEKKVLSARLDELKWMVYA
ncbi:hypothetical protein [Paraflavitalea pollutisoli]|uniref:hypothetical protein n=1 Tax=Paraflavitalea pollutisoli TaxID=3034143 RepID=UPI0023EAA96E|nr:hypothetical protein [Paraflavitalea sp. H1-2-19X]